MSTITQTDDAPNASTPVTDLTNAERSELIARIENLESRLRAQTAQLSALTSTSRADTEIPIRKPKKEHKPFDLSSYNTRHIALKFSYIGHPYNGFEHANNTTSAPPKPTIEEVLWKALRKARLIAPDIPEGSDTSFEVLWDEKERAERYGTGIEGLGRGRRGKERLELNWEGCTYSKCGRTDKGVSAFGQVIGITVRSSRPKARSRRSSDAASTKEEKVVSDDNVVDELPHTPAWDSVRDELPYISILNSLLPPTIRVLAWCPHPPPDFDARFSCQERRYKYFFTNPAFCPTPGTLGLQTATGQKAKLRDGWLDIDAMKIAAKKLEGLHDYRNLCKLDASKQMTSCERRITFADVDEFQGGVGAFVHDSRLDADGSAVNGTAAGLVQSIVGGVNCDGPKVYYFAVHGTAFLWHQVRCMVAVLFLVGQGLEKPELVDDLLDVVKNPGKPHYEMADDAPLVLWDCVFPGDEDGGEAGMRWVFAGDEVSPPGLATRGDGKFGVGGLVNELWTQWRETKVQETLAAGLLGLALGQGDGTSFDRGGLRDVEAAKSRGQKVFDGSSIPRSVGDYTPAMQRPRMESLEVQNTKYMSGKQARRDAKRS